MSNAVLKHESEAVVQPDPKAALEAALLRASQVSAVSRTLLDLISKDEWASMDARADNINVFDPD